MQRVCRSSLSCEVQALIEAEDETHLVRVAWAEFNGNFFDPKDHNMAASSVPGILCIDAKSIYDAIIHRNQPISLSEKRTALELLAYLKNTEANQLKTHWVHGAANLSDSLTKLGAYEQMEIFFRHRCRWSIIYDEKNLSAKKRRSLGLERFEQTASTASFSENLYTVLAELWDGVLEEDPEEWLAAFPKNIE